MNYDTIDTIREIVEGAIKDKSVIGKDRWLEVLYLLGRLRKERSKFVVNISLPKETTADDALFEQKVLETVANALSR